MIPIRDTVPSRSAPVVTWSLIAINAVVFLYELMLSPAALERFFYLFGVVPARFTHPEWALSVGFPADDYWPFCRSCSCRSSSSCPRSPISCSGS